MRLSVFSNPHLGSSGLELLTLTQISGEGDHLAVVGVLEPLEDDGGVEAAGVGEDDLWDDGPNEAQTAGTRSEEGGEGEREGEGIDARLLGASSADDWSC